MEEKNAKVKTERSDKKIRVNSSFSKPIHEKLQKLAIACGVTKTELQAHLVELCLANENIINYVQDEFRKTSHFRIIPTKMDGELKFVFVEKVKAN